MSRILPLFGVRMNTLGFRSFTTDGNCRAYIKDLAGSRYVLVTDNTGCDVDGISEDNWIVGLYNADGEVMMWYADGGSIDTALRAVGVQL